MLESLLLRTGAVARHRSAPLLAEREQFLTHLQNGGSSRQRLRTVAACLLQIMRLMNLQTLRPIRPEEVTQAAWLWAEREPERNRDAIHTNARCFVNIATKWFHFHGILQVPARAALPFEDMVNDYERWILWKGLTPATIQGYVWRVKTFLSWLAQRQDNFALVQLSDIDAYLVAKREAGWRQSSRATQIPGLRSFFRYAEMRGWCSSGIAGGVRGPRYPKRSVAPQGPTWSEVRRLLRSAQGTNAASYRAHAILCLLSIYGLRRSEVARLQLGDFDWREETFRVRRLKGGYTQSYPIQYEVGQAILAYLMKARPRCGSRYLFLSLYPPFRPIHPASMCEIVSIRMQCAGIVSKQRGPHALRHACATQLLKKGVPLKEVGDFLGHRDTKSVSIYAKYDLRSLRKVASFRLGAIL